MFVRFEFHIWRIVSWGSDILSMSWRPPGLNRKDSNILKEGVGITYFRIFHPLRIFQARKGHKLFLFSDPIEFQRINTFTACAALPAAATAARTMGTGQERGRRSWCWEGAGYIPPRYTIFLVWGAILMVVMMLRRWDGAKIFPPFGGQPHFIWEKFRECILIRFWNSQLDRAILILFYKYLCLCDVTGVVICRAWSWRANWPTGASFDIVNLLTHQASVRASFFSLKKIFFFCSNLIPAYKNYYFYKS